MRRQNRLDVVWVSIVPLFLFGYVEAEEPAFQFKDVGKESGLQSIIQGAHGHAAGWGDVDGDGWPDLCLGTFHTEGPPNLLIRNHKGKFSLDSGKDVRISTRSTATLFADLDNDGDLDLYVGSMPKSADSKLAKRIGHPLVGCSLFRNDGGGKFTNISKGNGACPEKFGGRCATVLDFDGDGLLDLLVGEDPLKGYNGSPTASSRLFRNLGKLKFEDVSQQAGLPKDIPGLGVAAGDVNNDGWPDIFLACGGPKGNRLFLNDAKGRFREAPGSHEVFVWPDARGDNMCCGVVMGDVNGDGLLDIILGQHFEKPWVKPVSNRLYLNRGIKDGVPRFEDVTKSAGLVPLPMKSPHVEIQDFDNDGRPDIYTSMVKFREGIPHPVIFRNLGNRDGVPRFKADALEVNDFPTDDDKAVKRTGTFFEKMIADKKVLYTAPGPSADFNRDGRLDLFLANWWSNSPSLLLKNETPSGHWLQVRLDSDKTNRMGIGSRIYVYEAGKLNQEKALIGCRELASGFGYASSQEAIAHFGLGKHDKVDINIVLPHGKGTIKRKGVKADQRLKLSP